MPDANPSFPMLVQRFFLDHLRQQRAVSPNTSASYRDTFRLFLHFAHQHTGKEPTKLTLFDLNTDLILAFLNHLEQERKNSVRSRNARLSAIRAFLKYAAHRDITALATIERCLSIPQKRHDKPVMGFLSRPEMAAIIAAPDRTTWAGLRDQALFSLLYNTGARVSEVINLKVGDVVVETAPVAHLHGKGRKQRSVPLWKATAVTLRHWVRHLQDSTPQAYLFPNSAGGRLSRSSVAQRLANAVDVATQQCPKLSNRSVSPHTIRHTTAMHLLQSGVDIVVISLWLGHEETSTTHHYLEADLTMKEQALSRLDPLSARPMRYRPPDKLLAFLEAL